MKIIDMTVKEFIALAGEIQHPTKYRLLTLRIGMSAQKPVDIVVEWYDEDTGHHPLGIEANPGELLKDIEVAEAAFLLRSRGWDLKEPRLVDAKKQLADAEAEEVPSRPIGAVLQP